MIVDCLKDILGFWRRGQLILTGNIKGVTEKIAVGSGRMGKC